MNQENRFSKRQALPVLASLIVGLVLVFGTARPAPRVPDKETQNDKFKARLLEIAKNYHTFGRVDDEWRWAPWLCRIPNPGGVKFSVSSDNKTHGQKLYSLFAKDRKAYMESSDKKQPVGQVLVKQSWHAEVFKEKKFPKRPKVQKIKVPYTTKEGKTVQMEVYEAFHPFASKGEKVYKAAKQADLFIMFKEGPATTGTDQGWVYGTVTPEGKTVTSVGQVASCIKCHQKAGNDRLFGLPKKTVLKIESR